jgi:hypothetical protein
MYTPARGEVHNYGATKRTNNSSDAKKGMELQNEINSCASSDGAESKGISDDEVFASRTEHKRGRGRDKRGDTPVDLHQDTGSDGAGTKVKSYSAAASRRNDPDARKDTRQVQIAKGDNIKIQAPNRTTEQAFYGNSQETEFKFDPRASVVLEKWDKIDLKPDGGFLTFSKTRIALMQSTNGAPNSSISSQFDTVYKVSCLEYERLLY